MATEPMNRNPLNVSGGYYTTQDCDGCAYCASVAPENFDYDRSTNSYYVSRQPMSAAEEELVQEAMDDCPVDSIRKETLAIHQ